MAVEWKWSNGVLCPCQESFTFLEIRSWMMEEAEVLRENYRPSTRQPKLDNTRIFPEWDFN